MMSIFKFFRNSSYLAFWICVALLQCSLAYAQPQNLRAKDVGKLQGWRDNALLGWGIVTGLASTGDSASSKPTRQALSNVFSQFNLAIPPDQLQSRNVAVVMVSALLPPFAREGDRVDVLVSSAGDARSLVGGNLLLTSLNGPNGRIYALAQGPLSVGGYRYDGNGNVVQKNHPTVGTIPGGALVEATVPQPTVVAGKAMFVLSDADYTTAKRLAEAFNRQVGEPVAQAIDATGIEILIPTRHQNRPVDFFALIESTTIEPDRRARIVINERTGTVVSGGDVKIDPIVISHGDLRINISSRTSAEQPTGGVFIGSGFRPQVITNSQIGVEEPTGPGVLVSKGPTVIDLIQSLNRLKTSSRDVISILRAVKAAGALHAELIIQ